MSSYEDFNWELTRTIPHYSGALSMAGSLWIILSQLFLGRKKLRRPSNRYILAISILDLFSSFWYFMAQWAHPKQDTVFDVGAETDKNGSVAMCEASGFFIQLGNIGIPLYNMALAVQYYLVIRYNWKADQVWKSFERYSHAVIIPLALALAIIPLPLDLYNPWYFYCWITPASYNAEINDFERGSSSSADWFYSIYFFLVFTTALIVTAIMIAIVFVVRRTVTKSFRYEFDATSSAKFNDAESEQLAVAETGLSPNSRKEIFKRAKRDIRLKQVATMAWLYTVPFYLTWAIPCSIFFKNFLAWRFMAKLGRMRLQYATQVYVSTAVPLQGFMNWFVFMYPWFHHIFQRNCCSSEGPVVNSSDSMKNTPSPPGSSGQVVRDSEIVFEFADSYDSEEDDEDDEEFDADRPEGTSAVEEESSGTLTPK